MVQQAAAEGVASVLSERFAWFLSPVRFKVIAEHLRVLYRQRDLNLGPVGIAVVLTAFSRSSGAEGRVRDA